MFKVKKERCFGFFMRCYIFPCNDVYEIVPCFQLVTTLQCKRCAKVTRATQTHNGLTVNIPKLLVKEARRDIL